MFWGITGVVAVVAVVHSNHSRYSRYSQYSDASLVAEIKAKEAQLERKQKELQSQKRRFQEEIEEYKKNLADELGTNSNLTTAELDKKANAYYKERIQKEVETDRNKILEIDALIDKINSILQGLFPPILAPEYLMDPKLFRVRLAFSDQSDMVRQVGEMLETFLKIGPEWYPKYKDLKITNPFFVYAMLISWGPRGQQMFGSHVLPFA